MRLERIKNLNEEMREIQPDNIGYRIMKDKTQILGFKIENLKLQAMQILKQDALSLNAELVTPRDAILCEKKGYDCLLFGSPKALKLLITKMQMQPFGLKALSKELKKILQPPKEFKKSIMSVINVDSDSFYKHFDVKNAITEIHKHIELGADIIDIGAVSTKPGSMLIQPEVELERLNKIFKEVVKLNTKTQFSIDTYNQEVAKVALQHGFNIINDISGNVENMLEVLQQCPKTTYILTHIQGNPTNMQENCKYQNLILDIDTYFEEKLKILSSIRHSKVILDVGIGFAKTPLQNVEILTKLSHFKRFNKPLLIGASHKSFLRKILQDSDVEQLEATLITHFIALQNGANILRVHDLISHKKILQLFEVFHNDIDLL